MVFDSDRFFREIDRKRRDESLSWRELARRLAISPSTFSRMSQGRKPDVDTFVALVSWLGAPASSFVLGPELPSQPSPDTLSQIGAALRRDSSLDSDAAEALEDIMRVAYRRFSGGTN